MKFRILLADPPWQFRTWSDKGMDRSPEYPVMTQEDINTMKVSSIAENDSILFMWATFPKLPDAIETMKCWGFEYKTVAFTWIKLNKNVQLDYATEKAKFDHISEYDIFTGLGYYTRANAEICLLGTRGNPMQFMPRLDRSVHSVVMSPIQNHSRKPDEVRGRIQRLFGKQPSIEIFAREKFDGWTCIGNEVTGNDIREDIKLIGERNG